MSDEPIMVDTDPKLLEQVQERAMMERAEKADNVTQAFFYHLNKHGMNNVDALMIMAGAFHIIKRSIENVDQQTEAEILFLSMIQNLEPK